MGGRDFAAVRALARDVGDELLNLLGGGWRHPHPAHRVAIGEENPLQEEPVEDLGQSGTMSAPVWMDHWRTVTSGSTRSIRCAAPEPIARPPQVGQSARP